MKFKRYVMVKIYLESEAIEIKDLRISFNVKKTRSSEQNTSEIKIYNLSETTRAKLKDEGKNLELFAGYADDIGLIFKGDIREIYHKREGENIVTTLTMGDGDNALTSSTVNVTLKGGITLKAYIKELVAKLKDIKIGRVVGLEGLAGNKTATTFTGHVRDELDRLAAKYDFDYTIENHVIDVVRNKSNTGLSEVISVETGMLETATVREDGYIEVKMFLNNNLKCNDLFRLESEFVKRDFRIDTLDFTGDTYGTEFATIIGGLSLE